MCDFKPGDEVVRTVPPSGVCNPTRVGVVYTVERVWTNPNSGCAALDLVGVWSGSPNGALSDFWGHRADRFRKVQRRATDLSVESFLTIKPGQFEEPKRTPAPAKRERV